MLEFVLARYNYWIVIILMMTGLYIVFSRGNLVKTIVGLNLFQTSVFIFYITVGKVIGGTAPILVGGHAEESYGDHHGAEPHHKDAHGASEGHLDAPPDYVGETQAADLSSQGGEASAHGADSHLEAPALGESNGYLSGAADLHGAAAGDVVLYSNPLPHVLILTAIVVGVATTAVGLALAVRIREAYGTVEEDDLEAMNNADEMAEAAA